MLTRVLCLDSDKHGNEMERVVRGYFTGDSVLDYAT